MGNNKLTLEIDIGPVAFIRCLNYNCKHFLLDLESESNCNLKNLVIDAQGKCIKFEVDPEKVNAKS